MIRLGKITPDLANRIGNMMASRSMVIPVDPPAVRQYTILNKAGADNEPAILDIYGEIGPWGITAAQFREDLLGVTAKRIEMRVSSPGGDVYDAIAILNLIRSHPAHVTARIDGLAASAASFLIQAADERVMMPHSQQMIHKAWGMTIGNEDDHAHMIEDLRRVDAEIASIYHDRVRGGQRMLAKIREKMVGPDGQGSWFTAQEAVDFGLADRVEKSAWQADAPEDVDDAGPEPEPADSAALVVDDATDDVRDDHATVDDNWADMLRIAIDELDDLEALLQ